MHIFATEITKTIEGENISLPPRGVRNMITPPDGSRIRIDNESGYQKIVIRQPSRGVMTYFSCVFLFFWLGGWAFGWIAVASRLLEHGTDATDVFLFFWLGFWTVGGVVAIWIFYKSLRPLVPETLTLSRPYPVYDSGIAPFKFTSGYRSQKDFWKKLFEKRLKTEFDQSQLKTLELKEFEDRNRLTIDQGNRRLEIATGATEPEREWLYEVLQKEYDL